MTIRRRPLYLGVFLVAAGAVMLIGQGANVDRGAVADALGLWPLAVVALGVGLLMRRTPAALPAGLVAAAMPGLLLGGLVVAGPDLSSSCGHLAPGETQTRQGTFATSAVVDLNLACGDLTVTTAPGNGWQVQTRSAAGATPSIVVAGDRISVASATRGHAFDLGRAGDSWQLTLPTARTLDLTTVISAGHGRLDLTGARLGRLDLSVSAAEATVDLEGATVDRVAMHVSAGSGSLRLPATGDLTADLSVSAGKLSVCAPAGLGVRVHGNASLGAINHAGLVRNGDAWESPGYASTPYHADVTVSASVGSVDINPQGGCQ